jgi:AraC-like DNA-binding protein
MSQSSNRLALDPAPDAVVCIANYAALTPGRAYCNPDVKSRMALWVKAGLGTITVNGARHEVKVGDYFFLPWAHRVEYEPDRRHPFLLAGIHIVPDHSRQHPVEFVVPHNVDHPLARCSWRRDVGFTFLRGLVHLQVREDEPLWLLSEYMVHRYLAKDWQEGQMRELAGLYLRELERTLATGHNPEARRSDADFRRLADHVTANLNAPLVVGDLAALLECSESTLGRLVRTHVRLSPVNWINHLRIQRARTLLTTTRLPVARVGERVGVSDPFYFSKLFRKYTGQSPLACRKSTPIL